MINEKNILNYLTLLNEIIYNDLEYNESVRNAVYNFIYPEDIKERNNIIKKIFNDGGWQMRGWGSYIWYNVRVGIQIIKKII